MSYLVRRAPNAGAAWHGLLDRDEAGTNDACDPPRDTDQDGIPDYRDQDSDGDWRSDADEKETFTDPTKADSNDDGCGDLEEYAFGVCNPSNAIVKTECGDPIAGTITLYSNSTSLVAPLTDLTFVLIVDEPSEYGTMVATPFTASQASIEDGKVASFGPHPAQVTFGLSHVGTPGGLSVNPSGSWTIRLQSKSHGVLAEGRVYWVHHPCP